MQRNEFSTVHLGNSEETARFGAHLAPRLRAGDTVLLSGPIGAGKTHLARNLIQTRLAEDGLIEDVPSPTFTLVQIYEASGLEVWHTDLYRLGSPDEAIELGIVDAFASALVLVEWPERLGALVPDGALWIDFQLESDARSIKLSSSDDSWPSRLGLRKFVYG